MEFKSINNQIKLRLQPFLKRSVSVAIYCTLLGLSSCTGSSDSEKILVENNFDGLVGWGIEHASITSERAYSGKHSLKIDGNIEFGLAFNQVLGKLTNKKPKRINVAFRAYIPSDQAKARFICKVLSPGATQIKFYQDFNLVDKTENYREWVKITKRLDLPENTELSDIFSCYLWRPEANNEAVFIDDLKVTILE